MACKITNNIERCKGCGLCVGVCPKGCIEISKRSNQVGYFPAVVTSSDCTGCSMCAIICPDAAIEISCESNIVDVKSNKKSTHKMVKDKV